MASVSFSEFTNFHAFNASFDASCSDSFTVAHVNIRSIRKYWNELKIIVDKVQDRIDALVLTEINTGVHHFSLFKLPGFQNYFYTRQNARGGGIAIYVKEFWTVEEVEMQFTSSESIALKVFNAIHSIYLITLYRPPSSNCTTFLEELKENLKTLTTESHLCMVGDVNIDTLKNSKPVVCDYLSLLSENGIHSTIQSSTREEVLNQKLVSSCLDHVNVRTSDASVQSSVISQKLADHYFVTCRYTFFSKHHKEIQSICQVEKLDINRFDRLIKAFDWSEFMSSVDTISLYPKFIEIIKRFQMMSKTVVRIKKRKPKLPWLTSEILDAIDHKEKLWKRSRRSPTNAALKLECKIYRNRVNALLRSAKRIYFANKISNARSNPRLTWSVVNELRGSTKKNVSLTLRKHFGFDMNLTVNALNSFFACSTLSSSTAVISTPAIPSVSESAFLPLLSEFELRSYIFGFKRFRSAGVDGITVNDLCRNYDTLKDVLLVIINSILESGNIPGELKQALVVPLFKGGSPDKVSSYRPISILSCISQILEKHLLLAMSGFLEKHNIISPHQYGFVAGRGTSCLLEKFSDFLHHSFENNMFTCALFIDVAKAFDTVNHDVLLSKLQRIGFRGPFYSLIKSFLSNRTQVVCVDNIRSALACLTSGVPQGSILSPLLFNIYVNDTSSVVTTCFIHQYADDTVLFSRHLDYQRAMEMLQVDAVNLMDWFSTNKLRVNTAKTKLICFRNPLKNVNLTFPLYLHTSNCTCTDCTPIQYVDSMKYLGVHFDCDLAWGTHMSHLCQRLRTVCCFMYNIKGILPLSIKKNIIHALAYSVLRYGITVFFNCSLQWHSRIDRILKGILKSVAYHTQYSSTDNLFESLQLPSFYSLFVQTVIRRHFWESEFKIPSNPCRELRCFVPYQIPSVRTRYGESLRKHYVPSLFNDFSHSLSSITSNKQLKRKLQNVFSDITRQ